MQNNEKKGDHHIQKPKAIYKEGVKIDADAKEMKNSKKGQQESEEELSENNQEDEEENEDAVSSDSY